ncbi:MAG: glycosyltransferase [Phocaeicola sp.]|nr:glycosyltransferase [Phocaeicola sp.]
MKILLINDFKIGGGAEIIFQKTFQTLKEAGHQVDMIYKYENITSPKSIFSYIFSINNYLHIQKKLKSNNYDLVYILNFSRAFSPSILYAIKKFKIKHPELKTIYNAHDAHIICPNSALNYYKKKTVILFKKTPSIKEFIFKRIDSRGVFFSILKKAQWILAYKILKLQNIFDIILCPSQFLAYRISEKYPQIKTEILRNPLDKTFLKNKSVYHPKISSPIKLIYFGRINSKEKGLEHLINNLPEDCDFIFDIYGDGPDENNLKELIYQLGFSHKIKLKGKLPWEKLMNLISNYDAFILPSHSYENAPLSIVEASYAGLFILTMDYGGMKELAEIVGNNFFINPINKKSLKDILYKITETNFLKPNLLPFSEDIFKNSLLYYISSTKNKS